MAGSVILTDALARQYFAPQPPAVNSPNTTPQSGAGFLGLHIPAFANPGYTQDSAHDTLWARSPQFTLNGAGDLTAWLAGGTGIGSLAGSNVASMPAVSSSLGFQGIALRNVNSGQFALSARKSTAGNAWELVSFSASQLAALDQSARYTLDLVDAGHGGWGWVNLDSVTIPGVIFSPSEPPVVALALLSNGHVRISIGGPSNFTYHVQATTNLADWTTHLTTNAPTLPFDWTDTNASNFLQRYYRVLLGP